MADAGRAGALVRSAAEVVLEQVVSDRGCSGRGRTTRLRLRWHSSDPQVVMAIVTAFPDHPSLPHGQWQIPLATLRAGLSGIGSGATDAGVTVRPRPFGHAVTLLFAWPGDPVRRPCGLTVAVDRLRRFLADIVQSLDGGVAFGDEQLGLPSGLA